MSRNRRPRKGGNPARPSRPCQAARFHAHEADPSDADTLTAIECCWKDLRARTAFAACRDRGVYVPAASLSTTYRKFRYQLTAAVDYSGSRDRPQPGRPHCYSSLARAAQPAVQIRVTACFPKIPYRSGTSRNDPTPGPIPSISVPPRDSQNRRRPSPDPARNHTTLPAVDAEPGR